VGDYAAAAREWRPAAEAELRALGVDVVDALLGNVSDALLGPIKSRLETVLDARGAAPGVERRILQGFKESEERAVTRALNAVVCSGERGGAFARLPRV